MPLLGFSLMVASALAVPAQAGAAEPALVPKQQVVSEFAACVLEQQPERVRALLASEQGSDEERSVAKRLMEGTASCTRGRAFITMRTGEARGALAEAVLKADAGLAGYADGLGVQDFARPTETTGRKFVIAYGQCLAARSPSQARALIVTDYDSAAERDAMMGFAAALKDCMPTGLAYQINIRDVRNHVASALYDRALAASGGGDKNA